MGDFLRKYRSWRSLDNWNRCLGLLVKLGLILGLPAVVFLLTSQAQVKWVTSCESSVNPAAIEAFYGKTGVPPTVQRVIQNYNDPPTLSLTVGWSQPLSSDARSITGFAEPSLLVASDKGSCAPAVTRLRSSVDASSSSTSFPSPAYVRALLHSDLSRSDKKRALAAMESARRFEVTVAATNESEATAKAEVLLPEGYERVEPKDDTRLILPGATDIFRFQSSRAPAVFSSSAFRVSWASDRVSNRTVLLVVVAIVLIMVGRILLREISGQELSDTTSDGRFPGPEG